MTHSELILLY